MVNHAAVRFFKTLLRPVGAGNKQREKYMIMADALDVSPNAIAVPDIDSMDGLMHTLFTLEDRKLIRILDVDGLICLRAEIFDGGTKAADFEQRLRAWQEQSAKLKAGEITKEDYDRWRYHYPDFDDTRIRAAVPPEEPVKSKRGRKPKTKE